MYVQAIQVLLCLFLCLTNLIAKFVAKSNAGTQSQPTLKGSQPFSGEYVRLFWVDDRATLERLAN